MSKIEKELQGATDVTPKKGEDRVDYLMRLMKGVAGLSEKDWDALSAEAQAWYNANAKARAAAKKAGEDVPDPADFQQEEEEEKPRNRRSSDEDDDKPRGGKKDDKDTGETTAVEKLKEGDRFKITTTRGKVIEGTVTENNKKKEFVAYKDKDGSEDDIDYSKVDSVEVFHGTAGASDEDGGDAEPAVGDEVEIVTKRGKKIKGVLAEMNNDELVIDVDGEKDDYARERIESITVLKKGKPAGGKSKKDEDEKPAKGKKDEPEEKGDEKRTRSTNEGVSVGVRIKELIADNLDASEADIGKMLKKEDIAFKENTLHLNYVDCHKFVDILKKKKLLKA